MGGCRVTFTISREGRSMPVTIGVPYASTAGARADANLTQPEIDLVSRSVQGMISRGITVTGDTFTIVENDSDLRTPPTARATARVPAVVLFGTAPVAGLPAPRVSGFASPTDPGQPTPIDGVDGFGMLRGRMYRRLPNGTWEPLNPTAVAAAPGAAGQPGTQGSQPPPASGTASGQASAEPGRRVTAPTRGSGRPPSSPPARNPFSGAGRRF